MHFRFNGLSGSVVHHIDSMYMVKAPTLEKEKKKNALSMPLWLCSKLQSTKRCHLTHYFKLLHLADLVVKKKKKTRFRESSDAHKCNKPRLPNI